MYLMSGALCALLCLNKTANSLEKHTVLDTETIPFRSDGLMAHAQKTKLHFSKLFQASVILISGSCLPPAVNDQS